MRNYLLALLILMQPFVAVAAPTNPQYIEEVAVGGGYSDTDGGADIDYQGNTRISGNLTVDGTISGTSSYGDDIPLTLGDGSDFNIYFDSGTSRLTIDDGTNDLLTISDDGTTATLRIEDIITTDDITVGDDLTVSGNNIIGVAGTASVFNTNVTTLNIGGAATTLTLGPDGTSTTSTLRASNIINMDGPTGGGSRNYLRVSASTSSRTYIGASSWSESSWHSFNMYGPTNNVAVTTSTNWVYGINSSYAGVMLFRGDTGQIDFNIAPEGGASASGTAIASWTTALTLSNAGNGTLAGDLTVTGGDITLGASDNFITSASNVMRFGGATNSSFRFHRDINTVGNTTSLNLEHDDSAGNQEISAQWYSQWSTNTDGSETSSVYYRGRSSGAYSIFLQYVGSTNSVTFPLSTALTVSGDLVVSGNDIVGVSGTGSVFNTNVTTLNIGGGASSGVNIGNASGTITLTGGLTLPNGENIATGTTTGSIFGATNLQKISFWGATPVVQPATISAFSDPGSWTDGDISDLATTVNAISSALRTIGLVAAS